MKQITERQIIIGMIVSDDYMQQIRQIWDSKYLLSTSAKKLARWCVEYYDQYNSVPKKNIEDIFLSKIKDKKDRITDDEAEDIQDILDSLSTEYERQQFNVRYVVDQTEKFINTRSLELHNEEIQTLLDKGEIEEAKKKAATYSSPTRRISNELDLSDEELLDLKLEQAFSEDTTPLFTLPGILGDFMNEYFVRDSFIAILAPEKMGKTWNLMELGIRASKAGCNVAFFQAGDMSESQQLRRIAINRAGKSDKEKYTGKQLTFVKDCFKNQTDSCSKRQRECDFGIFDPGEVTSREDVTKDLLLEKLQEYPEYKPCRNCMEFQTNKWGSVWPKEQNLGDPLTVDQAKKAVKKFFVDKKRRFKLVTYPNKTLTVKEILRKLEEWERQGFIPDVIIIDYADLLVGYMKEFRHNQNDIWMELRGLSQTKHVCLITATQADAKSRKQHTLTEDNFSEDKRKLAHVTAMFGLNGDPKGRERELGLVRINKIVVRDGEPDKNQIFVIQSLKQGKPFITSFL